MQRRRARAINTELFKDVLAEAEHAYASNSDYAISMARQATTIRNKRQIWNLRLELRAAETTAHRECSVAPDFCCTAKSPCGTGDCRFASGDLVFLELPPIPASAKTMERPVQAAHPDYTIETAVRPLQERRNRSA